MEKLCYDILKILLLFLSAHFSSASSSPYTVPDKYFINCGSDSNATLGTKTFTGDLSSHLCSTRNGEAINDSKPNTETSPLIYQTATLFRQASSYQLHIDEDGLYVVRLHFFGFISGDTDLSEALFNVSIEKFTLLSNFSVRTDDSPVVMEFLVPITAGKFGIYFVPTGDTNSLAFVNAMEVFLVPQDYYMQDEVPDVTFAGSKGNYSDLRTKCLQKVLRVNIGGPFINETSSERATAAADWEPDDPFRLPTGNSSKTKFFSGELKFGTTTTQENIVPDLVYRTCMKLEVKIDRHSNVSNISWHFNVRKNSLHLLRAHFCDIASLSAGITMFYIHIYNQFRQFVGPFSLFDLSDTAVPFFSDFVVLSDDSGFISVSVSPDETNGDGIAYMNGIEIMEFLQEPGVVRIHKELKKGRQFIIVGSVCGVLLCLICILGGVFTWFRCRKRKSLETVASHDRVQYVGGSRYNGTSKLTTNFPNFPTLNLKLKMAFAEILEATDNFDIKLLIGNGGFGKVYRGTLRNGMKVAVKRSFSSQGQGLLEFQTEVIILSKIHHRHLVSLIGYCAEKCEMVLVYEFMEKGTLREHLYSLKKEGSSARPALTWKQRLEICIGSAKGLLYLHTGSDGGIIHCDVKSTNILLDENYTAKVADFGLSRSGLPDPDELSSGVKGTFGYVDPEYFRTFQFTEKSDVYSFGVVLLEVLCARPAIVNSPNREETNLADWGLLWLQKGKAEKIMDPLLVGQVNRNSLRKFTEVVEKCLRETGEDRPTMLDICWDLEYALQLQQSRGQRQPHEDSNVDSALEFVDLDSMRLQGGKDDSSVKPCHDSDSAAFSQMWIAGGRLSMGKFHDEDSQISPTLLVFILLVSSIQLSSAAYTRPDKYFINCGSKDSLSLPNNWNFVGDLNSDSVSFTKQGSSEVDNISPSNVSPLYKTARVFRQRSSYQLEISSNGYYIVRLHFYASIDLSAAAFEVWACGFLLLPNFTIQNRTTSPVTKEFMLTVTRGKFLISFIPSSVSFAFINALEVFPLPENFTDDKVSHVNFTGSMSNYKGLLSRALHTVHRINVGGDTVTPENDTLWRTWIPDDSYLANPQSAKNAPLHTARLNYQDENSRYIAPDYVYRTAKEVRTDNGSQSRTLNITWSCAVTKNSKHLVRVHFCNIISYAVNVIWFNFNINGRFVLEIHPDIDNQWATPFVRDFVVDSGDAGLINITVATIEESPTETAFLNGLEIMQIMEGTAFAPSIKISNKKRNHVPIIVASAAGGLAILCIFAVVLVFVLKRKKHKPTENSEWSQITVSGAAGSNSKFSEGNPSASPVPNLNLCLKIPFPEIQSATKNFNKKMLIGKGGFGNVYQGTLRDGTRVAVKRSEPGSGQGLPEFLTEIMVLSKIRHRHLVSLIGYCDERSEMILIYEFMENGTLRDHLYGTNLPCLSWKQRLEICIGAADGLHYLHKGSAGGIIHRDVKSTNILLDEYIVAKVADFGLSRSGPTNDTHVSTDVKGTFGYLDPEYFRTQQLTEKSDVYSFGVVMLEVLCARPAIDASLQREQVNLAEWGMRCKQQEVLELIVDPKIKDQISPNSLRKFMDTAEKCLQEDSTERPAMGDVLWDLQYSLQLQKTAVKREPHEDSTTDASAFPNVQDLPSMDFTNSAIDNMPSLTSDLSLETSSEIFSASN